MHKLEFCKGNSIGMPSKCAVFAILRKLKGYKNSYLCITIFNLNLWVIFPSQENGTMIARRGYPVARD